jgi:YfiH family protein
MREMFKLFTKFPNLKSGISLKIDGSMELAGQSFFPNREKFFIKNQINPACTVSAGLVHSDNVAEAEAMEAGTVLLNTDGLVTRCLDLFLTVTVADCFPVYFYDPMGETIGLAHCGWRGVISNLLPKMAASMASTPSNLLVGIGPGIGPCHFEIKDDILLRFQDCQEAILEKDKKIFMDLPKIINNRLLESGILPQNIENIKECTFCRKDKYFSFRRDKPEKLQAMVAYIGLTKQVIAKNYC